MLESRWAAAVTLFLFTGRYRSTHFVKLENRSHCNIGGDIGRETGAKGDGEADKSENIGLFALKKAWEENTEALRVW